MGNGRTEIRCILSSLFRYKKIVIRRIQHISYLLEKSINVILKHKLLKDTRENEHNSEVNSRNKCINYITIKARETLVQKHSTCPNNIAIKIKYK